ncbi:hypothetical protein HYH03_018616 [Edaphochlamys debaryana]|uniref:Uncharacterized protein n=1 Tax=Edaphochlamys debaryana TaxID=47281 RepID=A0A835XEX8_9CHLO|nr:hypothetical protein HYH03_018616 [Edaphochlamys debaryana]|eukprot:KAG2482446.1 hypothetical protein HYH03_018616 [Edaphochlamys debaryana]
MAGLDLGPWARSKVASSIDYLERRNIQLPTAPTDPTDQWRWVEWATAVFAAALDAELGANVPPPAAPAVEGGGQGGQPSSSGSAASAAAGCLAAPPLSAPAGGSGSAPERGSAAAPESGSGPGSSGPGRAPPRDLPVHQQRAVGQVLAPGDARAAGQAPAAAGQAPAARDAGAPSPATEPGRQQLRTGALLRRAVPSSVLIGDAPSMLQVHVSGSSSGPQAWCGSKHWRMWRR